MTADINGMLKDRRKWAPFYNFSTVYATALQRHFQRAISFESLKLNTDPKHIHTRAINFLISDDTSGHAVSSFGALDIYVPIYEEGLRLLGRDEITHLFRAVVEKGIQIAMSELQLDLSALLTETDKLISSGWEHREKLFEIPHGTEADGEEVEIWLQIGLRKYRFITEKLHPACKRGARKDFVIGEPQQAHIARSVELLRHFGWNSRVIQHWLASAPIEYRSVPRSLRLP